MLKKIGLVLGGLVLLVALAGGGFYLWAGSAANASLARHFETHRVDFPIPFPLTDEEIAALRAERLKAATPPDPQPDPGRVAGATAALPAAAVAAPPPDPLAGVDLKAVALERARERGKHLVEARFACVECHGRDFGGGTMVDAMPVARLFGMNLTAGRGGVVGKYTPADWDRIVRHGVLPDGRPAAMPSLDYRFMSDRELSDVIAYIQAQPPVDREMAKPVLGPLGTVLMALGQIPLSADLIEHDKAHAVEPPPEGVTVEFGRHLGMVCAGCHGVDLTGGPVVGGDPSWAPAANLTPHPDGLAGYTYEDLRRALREGKGRGGRALRPPMNGIVAYGLKMTDNEMQALWTYLQSLPPRPSPKK